MTAITAAPRQCRTYLPDPGLSPDGRPGLIPAPTTTIPREPAILILDAGGRIHFCSEASLLQRTESELIGAPIRDLIPALPLRPNTPGYNIAYARFQFADEAWQRHWIRGSAQRLLLADLRIRAVVTAHRNWLIAVLRAIRIDRRDQEPFGWNRPPDVPPQRNGVDKPASSAPSSGRHPGADRGWLPSRNAESGW